MRAARALEDHHLRLRHNGITAPLELDGSMTGETFLAFVDQCLAPTMKRKDIIILDDLSAPKGPGIRDAIEAVGVTLRYLLQPDRDPIEIFFSQLKVFLRKLTQRTIPRLCRAIASFVPRLSARQARLPFTSAMQAMGAKKSQESSGPQPCRSANPRPYQSKLFTAHDLHEYHDAS